MFTQSKSPAALIVEPDSEHDPKSVQPSSHPHNLYC